MMILDGHIHIVNTQSKRDPLLRAMEEAGVDGGLVMSAMPSNMNPEAEAPERRLEHVLEFCQDQELLFPFFFLNPVEETALEQVDRAVRSGIAGFKIICTNFYPSDPRCVESYRHIASYKKPLVFHSGILWDGLNASGNYNKPTEFEVLLSIPGMRFALAHISWPWCDECVAVYGKFNNATLCSGGITTGEMVIDNTPGTPKIYREDALRKVLLTGYDVLQNMYFGLDNTVENYNVEWAKGWIKTDMTVYEELGLDSDAIQGIFSRNLLRFINMEPRR